MEFVATFGFTMSILIAVLFFFHLLVFHFGRNILQEEDDDELPVVYDSQAGGSEDK